MYRIFLGILRRNLGNFLALFSWSVIYGDASGSMGPLLLIGPLMLPLESGRDTITVIKTLPVTSRALSSVYWLLTVVIPALLYLTWSLAAGALWSEKPFDPLPQAMNALIGMGYMGAMVLAWIYGWRPHSKVSVVNVMAAIGWVGLCGAAFLLDGTLDKAYELGSPWFYVALFASPLAIGLSYRLAPRLTRPIPRRVNRRSTRHRTALALQSPAWLRFWGAKAGIALASSTVLLLLTYLSFRLQISQERFSGLFTLNCFTAIAVAKVAGVSCEKSLRTFRALPLSGARLTAYLVALQWLTLLASMLPLALALTAFNRFDLLWFMASYLVLGLALALSTSAMELRLGGGETPLIYIVFALSTYVIAQPLYLAAVALLLIAGAIWAIARLVQTRSEAYRKEDRELDMSKVASSP